MNRAAFLSEFDFAAKRDWVAAFHHFKVAAYEKLLAACPASFWKEAGEKRALKIFHVAAKTVPAYADFLKSNGVDPKTVRTIQDFAQVPPTDKENYINRYPLASRSWNGRLDGAKLLAMSSGTTGEPVLWPRAAFQEFEAAVTHELLYHSFFQIDRYRTLVIVGFPMGLYVSGVATALPSWLVSQKSYRLTVAPVGNDKILLLKLLNTVSSQFEQIIVVGHPLFVRDVIGAARVPSRVRVRLMFCSDGFSESWRAEIVAQCRQTRYQDVALSTYGSSELLLIAYETPDTVLLRQKLQRSSRLRAAMFEGNSVPNLFQYNPLLRFAEQMGDEVLFTAATGIPLIRFNLHDRARILPNSAVHAHVSAGAGAASWNLPVLALWGRSGNGVVLHAVNIYPEHIRFALDHIGLARNLTGRFVMKKRRPGGANEVLDIHFELAPGRVPTTALAEVVALRISETLLQVNIEYRDASRRLGERLRPRVILRPYQHAEYFRAGLKPKYVVQ